MPEPLPEALAQVRELLLGPALVRAVASGRRRGEQPAHQRAELRPVQLKTGRRLQLVSTDGRHPITRNLTPDQAGAAVDALIAEPFGNWFVQTADAVWQLRVTKRGDAQVHRSPTPPATPPPPSATPPHPRPRQAVTSRATRPAVPPRSDRSTSVGQPSDLTTGHDRVKARMLADDDPLFAALGAGADKRRQVDAFLRLLAPSAPRAADAAAAAGRPLTVVDLGCGNAYLTFAAHRWLATRYPDVVTVGVDTRPESMDRNARIAADLGLPGLTFLAGEIATAPVPTADLVLALHACDTATDDALARAVGWTAPVLLAAPCCHHDLQRQLVARWADQGGPPAPFGALGRDGILRERFADVLTDTLRAALLRLLGYRVDVVEFVDSAHTPRNLMLRAVRTGTAPDHRRRAEYADLVQQWAVRPALADRLADRVAAALEQVG